MPAGLLARDREVEGEGGPPFCDTTATLNMERAMPCGQAGMRVLPGGQYNGWTALGSSIR